MNNYGYGYSYPYYGNNYGYGVPQQQQYYQPQQIQQVQQAQPTQSNQQQMMAQQPRQRYLPITFVNGLVGAQSHILNPNEKIYLLDSDNPILYVKSADFEGKYTLQAFQLNEVSLDKIGSQKLDGNSTSNILTKEDLSGVALKSDLKALEQQFMGSMNKLSSLVENALKSSKNNSNAKNGG